MTCGRAKGVVILNPSFPDRNSNLTQRNELHSERVDPWLARFRPKTFFQARRQKRLLLRLDLTSDGGWFVTSQTKFITDRAWFDFLDYKRCLTKLAPIGYNRRSTWCAGDFHAAVCENKTRRIFAFRPPRASLATRER